MIQILNSAELSKKTFFCIVVNGLVYMGSVFLYNFIVSSIFGQSSQQNDQSATTHWFLGLV